MHVQVKKATKTFHFAMNSKIANKYYFELLNGVRSPLERI